MSFLSGTTLLWRYWNFKCFYDVFRFLSICLFVSWYSNFVLAFRFCAVFSVFSVFFDFLFLGIIPVFSQPIHAIIFSGIKSTRIYVKRSPYKNVVYYQFTEVTYSSSHVSSIFDELTQNTLTLRLWCEQKCYLFTCAVRKNKGSDYISLNKMRYRGRKKRSVHALYVHY